MSDSAAIPGDPAIRPTDELVLVGSDHGTMHQPRYHKPRDADSLRSDCHYLDGDGQALPRAVAADRRLKSCSVCFGESDVGGTTT